MSNRDENGRFVSADSMDRQVMLADFVLAEIDGVAFWIPADEYEEALHGDVVEKARGVFRRWSMAGYLDCTDWEPMRLNLTLKNSRWEGKENELE